MVVEVSLEKNCRAGRSIRDSRLDSEELYHCTLHTLICDCNTHCYAHTIGRHHTMDVVFLILS